MRIMSLKEIMAQNSVVDEHGERIKPRDILLAKRRKPVEEHEKEEKKEHAADILAVAVMQQAQAAIEVSRQNADAIDKIVSNLPSQKKGKVKVTVTGRNKSGQIETLMIEEIK